MKACALELRDVGFAYAGRAGCEGEALRGVSLRVPRGQCVCLTGASGCGKTTLTRLANGLIPAFYQGELQGQVLIEGVELARWEMDDLCRAVGSVFQNPRSQSFNLDTTSELAYGCENLGLPREGILRAVAEAVEALNLQDLLERDIRDLSGGQRQLLALGAACAMGADLFVLDEPTANLDAAATSAVKRALGRLKRRGKTILIVEHRLHWLDGLADRVVRMETGRIADDWTAREFAALPASTRERLGLRAWSLDEVRLGARDAQGDGPAGRGAEAGAPPSSPSLPSLPSLQADGLRAGYRPGADVLKGLSFSAEGGHAVAVIGRNGQGKSTLARVLAGLSRETYGGVSLDDRPLPVRERPDAVYLVLQEAGYQLFGASVQGELSLGRPRPDEAERARIASLIARFGLAGKEARHPASLSGGEKQRLALAVGVRADAPVLVLDEPTSGLDLANMRRCAAEVRRLARAGRCVLVVTHDAELAAAACDRVLEVADGRVRAAYDLNDDTLPRALRVLAPR